MAKDSNAMGHRWQPEGMEMSEIREVRGIEVEFIQPCYTMRNVVLRVNL